RETTHAQQQPGDRSRRTSERETAMQTMRRTSTGMRAALTALTLGMGAAAPALVTLMAPSPAVAQQFPAFRQALAEGVAENRELAAFYRENGYQAIWTGAEDAARRTALVSALSRAAEHGLPEARYDLPGLIAAFEAVETERDRGLLEAR